MKTSAALKRLAAKYPYTLWRVYPGISAASAFPKEGSSISNPCFFGSIIS